MPPAAHRLGLLLRLLEAWSHCWHPPTLNCDATTPCRLQLIDWGLLPHAALGVVALLASLNPAATNTVPSLQLIDWGLLPRAALGVVALLAGNGYIVGINQIYDVDIDAVNKPFLPVAAGAPWGV